VYIVKLPSVNFVRYTSLSNFYICIGFRLCTAFSTQLPPHNNQIVRPKQVGILIERWTKRVNGQCRATISAPSRFATIIHPAFPDYANTHRRTSTSQRTRQSEVCLLLAISVIHSLCVPFFMSVLVPPRPSIQIPLSCHPSLNLCQPESLIVLLHTTANSRIPPLMLSPQYHRTVDTPAPGACTPLRLIRPPD
jgi:hypothetical protein